jgi:glutathione S-transferase
MRRTLWGRSTSSNVMKVIWALETMKLPYERLDVGGPFGKTDTPEYRAMNPTRLVPTLQEDDFTMWESNAILRHLCNTNPTVAGDLWPQAPRSRAIVDQWLDAQQTVHNRPAAIVFLGLVRTPEAARDLAAIKTATAAVAGAFALLEPHLAVHPYIVGEHLTLADIAWGVHVHRWFTMPVDRPEIPHLRAWYDRLLQSPIYREHIARPLV